jgi:MFS transporter, PAT family, beta-lactamase induction signal transducer AmpG
LMAFSSATHDIAADGFYILALSERDQSFFVGIRSTFYRIAMIAGQGLLVMLAGYLEGERLLGAKPSVPLAWSATFLVLAGLFLLLSLYHRRALPFPSNDHGATEGRSRGFMAEFIATFLTFVRKKKFGYAVAFLLLYRFAESQLVKLASPFMLDPREVGGLGLATAEVGFIYGTVGVLALTLGGILGGVAAAKQGLKYWLWWMALAINIPNLLYLFLSYAQPESLFIVSACVALEQFGYGFGFAAYMLYMIYLSQGDHATAHYALCTGFMALGMMLPGMASGWIQELLGYQTFFLWISLATIPSFIVTALIHLEPEYGRKADQPS